MRLSAVAPIFIVVLFAAAGLAWALPQADAARGSAGRDLPALSYPANVLRVLDGDTIEAEVAVWPGHVVTTRVRIGGIDAPELRARCARERERALDARAALVDAVSVGDLVLMRVRPDKYYGRVVADLAIGTRDVGTDLITAGHAAAYGSRPDWCAERIAQRPQT